MFVCSVYLPISQYHEVEFYCVDYAHFSGFASFDSVWYVPGTFDDDGRAL